MGSTGRGARARLFGSILGLPGPACWGGGMRGAEGLFGLQASVDWCWAAVTVLWDISLRAVESAMGDTTAGTGLARKGSGGAGILALCGLMVQVR